MGWYKEDFGTGLLLNQSLSFKAYKLYITFTADAIFTHLVLKLHKYKTYERYSFKAAADTADNDELHL